MTQTSHQRASNRDRGAFISSIFLAGLLVSTQLAAEPFERPDVLIVTTAHKILEAIDGRRQELNQNPAALAKIVDEFFLPNFDTGYAGQLALGKHWRAATPVQRREFEDALYQSIVRTYAAGMLDFTADSLTASPFKGDVTDSRVLVRTKVLLSSGTMVPVDYRLRMTNDGWKIYDVIIEGISYITNYRKSVAAELANSDLDSLIKRLNGHADTAISVGATE